MLPQVNPNHTADNIIEYDFKARKIKNFEEDTNEATTGFEEDIKKPKTDSLYKDGSTVRKATKADPFANEEQYNKFKSALLSRRHGFRDYMMVVLQHTTGRRISDTVKLNIGDVYDVEARQVKSSFEVFEKKTKKYKKLKILSPLAEAISMYIEALEEKGVELHDEMPLFMSQVQTKSDRAKHSCIGRIKGSSAWRIYNEAAEACGIKREDTHISTHSPRKYLVKKHVEKYNDVKLMTHFLNHTDESTTLIYACITDDQVNSSLEAMFQ